MTNQLVIKLGKDTSVKTVGGKAYALGRMIRARFIIPEGFVVSATSQVMTPALEAEILKQFDALNADFVAVRSSAVSEDGADAAWAGQLDTFLNTTRDDLLQNIQKCWDSINSARAKAYAKQKSLSSGAVGVIVQTMVQSDVSGVAFSVHPITKNAGQIIIEAGLGLGEAIVSGQITPDTYLTDKKSGKIVEKHISRQTKKLVKDKTGKNVWEDLSDESQKLADQHIISLGQTVQKLESYFNHPVDVEWALVGDKLYILQSRPITTLA